MGIGLLLFAVLLWLLVVYAVAYVIGRMYRSSNVAISVWLGGIALPVLSLFVSVGLAAIGAIAAGLAHGIIRKKLSAQPSGPSNS